MSNRILPRRRRHRPVVALPLAAGDQARQLFHVLEYGTASDIDAEVDALTATGELPAVFGLVLGALWAALVDAHGDDLATAERAVHRALAELNDKENHHG